MNKCKSRSVKRLPTTSLSSKRERTRKNCIVAVNRIADNGGSSMRAVNPNLVRSSRLKLKLHRKSPAKTLNNPAMRNCSTTISDHRHFCALRRMATNRGINCNCIAGKMGIFAPWSRYYQGKITPSYTSFTELSRKMSVGRGSFCNDQ
jgi:hypothetical protein